MRRWRCLALATCLACSTLAAEAAQPSSDPAFAIPRPEVIATIKVIGVMPAEVDEIVPNRDELAARLDQEIALRLQRAGFNVVGAEAMRAIRANGLQALGGVYDPMTGVRLVDREAALREFCELEYRTHYAVDALVRSRVVRRSVSFIAGAAEWDGVSERVTNQTGIKAALQGFFAPMAGQAQALSVVVSLADAQGKRLYRASGGLMSLDYPTPGGGLRAYELTDPAAGAALADPSLISRALDVALDPLANGTHPTKSVGFILPPPPVPVRSAPVLRELLQAHPRIVLAQLVLPSPELPQAERVRARYQELLTTKLKSLGFEVASCEGFEELWAAERTAAGGFYDPVTGVPDLGRIRAAREHVLAALAQRQNVSAVALVSIVSRAVPFKMAYARWDGASSPVSGGGSFLYNMSIFNSSLADSGELSALSLRLEIIDADGQTLFEGFGGVQLTEHSRGGRVQPVPERELFEDPANDVLAVNEALRPLNPPRGKAP